MSAGSHVPVLHCPSSGHAKSVVSQKLLAQLFTVHGLPSGQGKVLLVATHGSPVVMFESQADALGTYHKAGIEVGKVQVSSAVCVRFDDIDPAERPEAVAQLAGFAEDRYLHQTMVRSSVDEAPRFFEDLPRALDTIAAPECATGEWRVHFHVPIYLEKFGYLHASRDDVHACLKAARQHSDVKHFEVETYAWDVLPLDLQHPQLATGIAKEMAWFADQLD